MKIGIIGAGLIGRILASKFSAAGHQVKLADRKGVVAIQALADMACVEAVEMHDVISDITVIIVAIPLMAIPDLAESLQGKLDKNVILVETTNYWPHRDGKIEALENGMVNSVWVQQQLGRPVIKAFSNINAYSLFTEGKDQGWEGRIALAVSGDDQNARELVSVLVNDAGFDALDAGPLEESWRQQACSPAYCTDLNLHQLAEARKAAQRELLKEKQQIAFSKMRAYGEQYFDILISGNYPEGFVDHAVDIYRDINGLPTRKL